MRAANEDTKAAAANAKALAREARELEKALKGVGGAAAETARQIDYLLKQDHSGQLSRSVLASLPAEEVARLARGGGYAAAGGVPVTRLPGPLPVGGADGRAPVTRLPGPSPVPVSPATRLPGISPVAAPAGTYPVTRLPGPQPVHSSGGDLPPPPPELEPHGPVRSAGTSATWPTSATDSRSGRGGPPSPSCGAWASSSYGRAGRPAPSASAAGWPGRGRRPSQPGRTSPRRPSTPTPRPAPCGAPSGSSTPGAPGGRPSPGR